MFSLKGKTAIITGASGYLGRSITEALLYQECDVNIFGRGNKIIKLYNLLHDTYRRCKITYYDVDLYDTDKFKFYLEDTIKYNKKIDILINNAFDFSKDTGFNDESGRFENMSKEKFMKGIESGVYWYFLSSQIIGLHMCKNKNGSIINIGSIYGTGGISPDINKLYEGTSNFNPVTYSISKSALIGLTKYSATLFSKSNVRVNLLCPGMFPNVQGGVNKASNVIVDRLITKTPLGRTGIPSDLSGAIIFLASDSSNFMTGQSIVIDGGFTII